MALSEPLASSFAADPSAAPPPPSLWSRELAGLSLALFALASIVAFESLAVVTAMPVVAADLNGVALYAMAFAAPVAVGIPVRTLTAPWVDRRGPGAALRGGGLIFVGGTLLCAAAPTMEVFLLGRAVQGIGAGAIGVALYATIAVRYPTDLRPRALTLLTAAWTVPAIAGPGLAGAVAHLLGWRSVFVVPAVLAVIGLAVAWRPVGRAGGADPWARLDARRATASVLAALALLGVVLSGRALAEADSPRTAAVGLIAALALLVACAPRLAPDGTWTGGRGLPSLLGARAFLTAGFFATEAWVPLALVTQRDLSPGLAGSVLTGSALGWFAGSWWVARRAGESGAAVSGAVIGAIAVVTGCLAGWLALLTVVPLPLVFAAWALAGAGMGAALSAIAARVFDITPPERAGATSAELQTAESVAEATTVAIVAVIFAVLVGHGEIVALSTVVTVSPLVAALGLVLLLTRGSAVSGGSGHRGGGDASA